MSTNPYPAQQPKPKKSLLKKVLIAGAILLGLLVLLVSCTALLATPSAPPTQTESITEGDPVPPPSETENREEGSSAYTVTLRATSTSEASVMYGPGGSSSTVDLAPGEQWEVVIENADRAEWYTVSVSESTYTDSTAAVSCEILVNGEPVDVQKGTGAGAYTNCSTL